MVPHDLMAITEVFFEKVLTFIIAVSESTDIGILLNLSHSLRSA